MQSLNFMKIYESHLSLNYITPHYLMNRLWISCILSNIYNSTLQIVHVTLDNYEPDTNNEDIERGEAHHNWVDEVVRCEGRGGAGVGGEISPSYMIIRPRPEKREPSLLTRSTSFLAKMESLHAKMWKFS